MANKTNWFVIINPTSGNNSSKQKWPKIKSLLEAQEFQFEFKFTEYANHSVKITQNAIKQGFKNIICVGGNGTLHNILNGIMTQTHVNSADINIGVIAIGTGNDWIKTHQLSQNIEKAIQVIKNGKTKLQDIGEIKLLNHHQKKVYFMNLAGVGFDGFVVSKVHKYKYLGALAYLTGTLLGLFSFKNFNSKTTIDSEIIESKTLMVLIGLCQFSGGGMQLTKTPNPFDGLFDISIAKHISKLDIIKNVSKLFNGKIVNHKKVATYKTDAISVEVTDKQLPFIQADGELIGNGNLNIKLIPKAFSFYC